VHVKCHGQAVGVRPHTPGHSLVRTVLLFSEKFGKAIQTKDCNIGRVGSDLQSKDLPNLCSASKTRLSSANTSGEDLSLLRYGRRYRKGGGEGEVSRNASHVAVGTQVLPNLLVQVLTP